MEAVYIKYMATVAAYKQNFNYHRLIHGFHKSYFLYHRFSEINMATNVSRRFAETTEEEIQTKRLKLNADNTLKSNKKSANILREYIKEKNQDSLFENYVTVRLNETLAHFYTDLRKPDGGRYKSTSFESIRG